MFQMHVRRNSTDGTETIHADPRRPSHSIVRSDLDLSPSASDFTPMPWNNSMLEENISAGSSHSSSMTFREIDDAPFRQHHLSYSGAGRFWKPPEEIEFRKGFFGKKRRSHTASKSQSFDSMSYAEETAAMAPLSRPPSYSSGPRSCSGDTDSILSEQSAGNGSLYNSDDPVAFRSPNSTHTDQNVFSSYGTAQPLAQRIANDDRKRKAAQHLYRLHELEEAKVAQMREMEEVFGASATKTQASRQRASSARNFELPDALRLKSAIPKDTWRMDDLYSDRKESVASLLQDNSHQDRYEVPLLPPEIKLPPTVETHLPELPTPNNGNPAIVVRAPTQKDSIRSDASTATSITKVDTVQEHELEASFYQEQAAVHENGLHITEYELRMLRNDLDQKIPLVSSTLPLVDHKSMDQIPVAQEIPDSQPDSLFAGLNLLKHSLPSRNTKPELLLQHTLQSSRSSDTLRSSFSANELFWPVPRPPDSRVELSATASVSRKSRLDIKPSDYRETSGHINVSQFNTLPHESFPLSLRQQVTQTQQRYDSHSIANLEAEERIKKPSTLPTINIEPEIDPRTGRPYVNVSSSTHW